MWKLLTEKGEKLPDLLVVLAITLVLAAVLLPAVTSTHGNEVNAESGIQVNQAMLDGPVRSAPRSFNKDRYANTDSDEGVIAVDQDVLAEDASLVIEDAVQPGIAQMRTTDISYVIP